MLPTPLTRKAWPRSRKSARRSSRADRGTQTVVAAEML
jgi:hypothetical protein